MQVAHETGQTVIGTTRPVPLSRPFTWLRAGLADIIHHPAASLAHGALVSALGLVLLVLGSGYLYFAAAAISGFLLVGPIMATGLCELSRQREAGKPVDFETSLNALTRNQPPLLRFAGVLLGIGIIWFALSVVILHALLGAPDPSLASSLWGGLFGILSTREIVVYLSVGGTMALGVFCISVITVPALVDGTASARQAMRRSVDAVSAHPGTMLVWAVIVVILTLLGFATGLLGLVVIYPLLGHATWHAYRDLTG